MRIVLAGGCQDGIAFLNANASVCIRINITAEFAAAAAVGIADETNLGRNVAGTPKATARQQHAHRPNFTRYFHNPSLYYLGCLRVIENIVR